MRSDQHRDTVLLVDDDPDFCALSRLLLDKAGYSTDVRPDGASCLEALATTLPDTVLLDMALPDMDGLQVLGRILEMNRHLPVVMLTADDSVPKVVAAMRAGAYDYVTKPVERTALITAVKRAVERGRMSVRLAELEMELGELGYSGMVGSSVPMRKLFRQLERVAAAEITVLIQGESGTGKELVARAIHDRSSRCKRSFSALNCAAIPETLQESELFGHEKGAFTGAASRRKGRFEQADGGTLFLDEVDELSLPLQAKLLRVLQERSFRRLGGNDEVTSDFRLLAAAQRPLFEYVSDGTFREDLYYRIAVYELTVPPLRERAEDIPLLARRFVETFAADMGVETPPDIDAAAMERVCSYRWPGNVRELQNALQHAMVEMEGTSIKLSDLPPRIAFDAEAVATAAGLVQTKAITDKAAPTAPTLESVEKAAVQRALENNKGNVSAAIRELGIGRATFYRKMKKYGLR